MEYTIVHETSYYYPEAVHESYTVVHLQPTSDAQQFCTRFDLSVSPKVRVLTYIDRFSNHVQHFAILPAHQSLSIRARSIVTTLRGSEPTLPSEATSSRLFEDAKVARLYDFLHESQFVQFGPEVEAFYAEVGHAPEAIGPWCYEVCHAINRAFRYDTAATSVQTTVAEVLGHRSGVCQDFAHVMIAVLRRAGIPARYVSGYIFRGESPVLGAEASHAWCEAYLPPYGWVGFDPTNDLLIDEAFVKIGIGRDYRDVCPVRGVFKGSAVGAMSVNVAMDALQNQQ
jgi:transglutaminase-like putative cysteine protease